MSKQLNQIKAYAQKSNLPIIPVQAKDIVLIREPELFYKTILTNIKLTKHRLALSALYLGTGPKERAIVQSILEALKGNNKLDVNITLDANRGRRLDSQGHSSVSILDRVLVHQNTKLGLIEAGDSTSIINKLFKRFQKLNELSSTYHAKFLIFDNNLMITGANLSNIYFEKRQDRYLYINNSQILSDYMFQLLDKINSRSSFRQIVDSHNKDFISKSSNIINHESDCYIVPLIQHGPSGLTDKEDLMKFIDSILPVHAQVFLSSGYFNPSQVVGQLKLDSILAPSEDANGFFGGSGLLKHVPRLYSALHKRYLSKHVGSQLFWYDRPEWSFHAKGLWVKGIDDLYIHLIGSSNFNYRSSDRDFEAQLLLLTTNKSLIKQLEAERESLWSASYPVQLQDIRGINWVYSICSRFFRSFL